MHQHLLWVLDERSFWHFNFPFGSSRIAGSAYQKRPTRINHYFLKSFHVVEQMTFLTHLKFENKSRMFHPRKGARGALPRHARLLLIIRFTRSNYFAELRFDSAILRETSEETSY